MNLVRAFDVVVSVAAVPERFSSAATSVGTCCRVVKRMVTSDSENHVPTQQAPVSAPVLWCVAATIVATDDGEATRRGGTGGTKLFKPGAKVYVIAPVPQANGLWVAIGRHRKSKQFVKGEVPTAMLTELGLEAVDTPNVIALARKHFAPLKDFCTQESAAALARTIEAF